MRCGATAHHSIFNSARSCSASARTRREPAHYWPRRVAARQHRDQQLRDRRPGRGRRGHDVRVGRHKRSVTDGESGSRKAKLRRTGRLKGPDRDNGQLDPKDSRRVLRKSVIATSGQTIATNDSSRKQPALAATAGRHARMRRQIARVARPSGRGTRSLRASAWHFTSTYSPPGYSLPTKSSTGRRLNASCATAATMAVRTRQFVP